MAKLAKQPAGFEPAYTISVAYDWPHATANQLRKFTEIKRRTTKPATSDTGLKPV